MNNLQYTKNPAQRPHGGDLFLFTHLLVEVSVLFSPNLKMHSKNMCPPPIPFKPSFRILLSGELRKTIPGYKTVRFHAPSFSSPLTSRA